MRCDNGLPGAGENIGLNHILSTNFSQSFDVVGIWARMVTEIYMLVGRAWSQKTDFSCSPAGLGRDVKFIHPCQPKVFGVISNTYKGARPAYAIGYLYTNPMPGYS